jgi:hypothetical protein
MSTMSSKTYGRIVGSMFLLAFGRVRRRQPAGHLRYRRAGRAGRRHRVEGRLTAGVLLMLLNSAVVIAIGVAAYPVLKRHHPLTASAYLLTRGFEAALLAVSTVLLLSFVPLAKEFDTSGDPSVATAALVVHETSLNSYSVAMIGLSLGSLLFCRALFRARLVPRTLAALGFVGYVSLATSGALELFGHSYGFLLLAPGAVFEATVGLLLVIKGFPEVQSQDLPAAAAPAPATRLRTAERA